MATHGKVLVRCMVPLLLAVVGCRSSDRGNPVAEAAGHPDAFFMAQASQINAAEIATGRLAVERAQHPDVAAFGQQMIDDHRAAEEELTRLAEEKGVALPDRPDEQHQMLSKHLSQLEGARFDREYMSAMTADHAKALSLFQDKSLLASDPDVRLWAEAQVPMFREHLDSARALDQRLGGASTVEAGYDLPSEWPVDTGR